MKKVIFTASLAATFCMGSIAAAQFGDFWNKNEIAPVLLVVPDEFGGYKPFSKSPTFETFTKSQVVPIVIVEPAKSLMPGYTAIGNTSLMPDTWQKGNIRPVVGVELSPTSGFYQYKKSCRLF